MSPEATTTFAWRHRHDYVCKYEASDREWVKFTVVGMAWSADGMRCATIDNAGKLITKFRIHGATHQLEHNFALLPFSTIGLTWSPSGNALAIFGHFYREDGARLFVYHFCPEHKRWIATLVNHNAAYYVMAAAWANETTLVYTHGSQVDTWSTTPTHRYIVELFNIANTLKDFAKVRALHPLPPEEGKARVRLITQTNSGTIVYHITLGKIRPKERPEVKETLTLDYFLTFVFDLGERWATFKDGKIEVWSGEKFQQEFFLREGGEKIENVAAMAWAPLARQFVWVDNDWKLHLSQKLKGVASPASCPPSEGGDRLADIAHQVCRTLNRVKDLIGGLQTLVTILKTKKQISDSKGTRFQIKLSKKQAEIKRLENAMKTAECNLAACKSRRQIYLEGLRKIAEIATTGTSSPPTTRKGV